MINGIQKTSLIDFPGKICCTLFLGECQLRCGYCYNVDLVLNSRKLQKIDDDEVISFLEKKKKYLEGVCITGGEPTLYPDLDELCKKIKRMGYAIKLDTNGLNPEKVKELCDKKLLDYIAMDVKASKENYEKVVGVKIDLSKIEETIKFLINGEVDYEFRTTVVPTQFDEKEAEEIGKWIKGAKRYLLQQFRPTKTHINPKFSKIEPYSAEQLKTFKKIAERYVQNVGIRGLE